MEKQKVVLIAGPTGVGKTASSVVLAKKLNTEIISCDSMQIYEGMDIGTAKVTPLEADGVVHHMTDIISPDKSFSVCDYVDMAKRCIEEIAKDGKIPLVVGGTGLYADSLLKGIDFDKDASKDDSYRKHLVSVAEQKGREYLHTLLKEKDRESADAIHPNNVKRVIRALEYYHITGEKISHHNECTKNKEAPYNSVRIYFTRERENLYKRIDMRVDEMIELGLEDEVKALKEKGIGEDTTAMQAIGYKEMYAYLTKKIGFDEAVNLIKQSSRHYAKRQLTWFKRDKDGIWLNLDEFSSTEDIAQRCMEIIRRSL